MKNLPEQALTGGVVTPQIVGSLRALLTLILIPKESAVLLPNSLHKQIGLPSINPANSGQHPLSGFVNLLPSSTNVKQSDIFVRAIKHPSSAGDGAKTAVSGAGDWAKAAADTPSPWNESDAKIKETMATTNVVVAILVFVIGFGLCYVFCFVDLFWKFVLNWICVIMIGRLYSWSK